jgi:hypothetical protein
MQEEAIRDKTRQGGKKRQAETRRRGKERQDEANRDK